MWYNHLDRSKPYLRSYRNVNLHVDQYDTRLKGPRVASWHINLFRRMGKHYSGVSLSYNQHRTLGFIYGTTFLSFAIFMRGFTEQKRAVEKMRGLKKQFPGKKVFKFTVSPNPKKELNKDTDNGYYVSKSTSELVLRDGNVLFNLMNTFRVISCEGNEAELEYGYLPKLLLARELDRQNRDGEHSVKVLELCEAVAKYYLKSQSFLFRLIGRDKESTRVSKAIIDSTSKGQA